MKYEPDLPLMVQGERTILLEAEHPQFPEVRDQIALFADLEKSPHHLHTYRISPLSLWNAAAGGMHADQILSILERYSKFDIPQKMKVEIRDQIERYGLFQLRRSNTRETADSELLIEGRSVQGEEILKKIMNYPSIRKYLTRQEGPPWYVDANHRGHIKQEFVKLGYPLQDFAGYTDGDPLPIELRQTTREGGRPFHLRPYQREAVQSFYRGGSDQGGSGVIVLPCGAGKTIVGIAAMAEMKRATLILTTNHTSVQQWIKEILDKTSLTSDQIAAYAGTKKEIRPVTVATYHMLTYRKSSQDDFSHMSLFNERNWGLIIYDEIHLLPAPVFRATANIQARRRLGLTATLVREDRREAEVFSLVGPKTYDAPWKKLENEGWIARATCVEVRTSMDQQWREQYGKSGPRQKYQIASTNPHKIEVVERLLTRHRHDQVLIIGQYLDQLREISRRFHIPLITGEVNQKERDDLYRQFKEGAFRVLAVSRVANFAVDLPDASVAIQISGTFGSRQEEAQRLGRILRPKQKDNRAYFYTVVSRDSKDQEYALRRQMFLIEQGYEYHIMDEEKLMEESI